MLNPYLGFALVFLPVAANGALGNLLQRYRTRELASLRHGGPFQIYRHDTYSEAGKRLLDWYVATAIGTIVAAVGVNVVALIKR